MKSSIFLLLSCLWLILLPTFSIGDEIPVNDVSFEMNPGNPNPNQEANKGETSADNANENYEDGVEYSGNDTPEEIDSGEEEDFKPIDLSSVAQTVESSNRLLYDMKDELDDYMQGNNDNKYAMRKLMEESSNLVKKIGGMFQRLTKREAEIINDMKGLKKNLNGAVDNLKNTLEIDGSRLRRHLNAQHGGEGPYKACVSIESVGDGRIMEPLFPEGNVAIHPSANARVTPTPSVQEFMPAIASLNVPSPNIPPPNVLPPNVPPPDSYQHQNPNAFSNGPPPQGENPPTPVSSGSQNPPIQKQQGDDVYLSQTAWLRLHQNRKQENLHAALDALLKEHQQNERDVLLIPISHKFKSPQEVKDGFMRAVRVRPEAIKTLKPKSPLFRKLRSLEIREL